MPAMGKGDKEGIKYTINGCSVCVCVCGVCVCGGGADTGMWRCVCACVRRGVRYRYVEVCGWVREEGEREGREGAESL